MFNTESLFNLFSLGCIITIIVLFVIIMFKADKESQMQATMDKLKKSLEEMDEQAKLVVRTDLELNKAQEELDKKITGLYALQQLSRAISTTLEENQIFKSMEISYLEDLGFEKALAFLWDDATQAFSIHLNLAYTQEELGPAVSFVESNKDMFLHLIKHETNLSSISSMENVPAKERIPQTFKVAFFVVSPILPKDGNKGFLFVGTENKDTPITEGDEESIAILANQLGQALENARLFEKTWHAHQELEKRVEERTRELTRVLDEVKIINKRKTDFVSSVSHELRTPLTSIKGYASILLTGKLGQLPEDVKLRLERINRHSDELVRLVNDLLDIARIESGRVTMKQEPQDLKRIVEEVIDLLSVQAKEKQIELVPNVADDAVTVLADSNQLQRVFINIINNAIKFTPAKGKITVKSFKAKNGEIQVDISDTGCGISQEAQQKLFEEFYRVDNPINQQVKGTGLGLALVKHIIEAHGGKIWVTSTPGTGSTFSFTLPQIHA